jgi:hypothetical protein
LGSKEVTADNRVEHTADLTAEILGFKVTELADTVSDNSIIPRSAVEDARKRDFPSEGEVLPELTMLKMTITGEKDKQNCSATEMRMSEMTITTPSEPCACMECDSSLSKKKWIIHGLENRS